VPICLLAVAAPAIGQRLEPHPPVVCGGTEDPVLENVSIETDGNGVVVTGNCEITIRNSRIVAGGYAIVAVHNGEVDLRDSHAEGAKGGLVALDHGEITYRGSTIRGGAAGSGRHFELDDGGGNDVSGRVAELPTTTVILSASSAQATASGATPSVQVDASGVRVGAGEAAVTVDAQGVRVGAGQASVGVDAQGVRVGAGQAAVTVDAQGVRVGTGGATVTLAAGEPIVCAKNATIVIDGQDIETDGEGVAVLANCRVTIRNSRIVAGGYAVLNAATGTIEIENSQVEGRRGGILLSGNGTVRYRGSVVRGGALSTAKGSLVDQGDNEVSGNVDLSALGDALQRAASGGSASLGRSGAAAVDAAGAAVGAAGAAAGSAVDAASALLDAAGRAAGAAGAVAGAAAGAAGDLAGAAGAAIDAAWRTRASRFSAADTARLLDELGARVEGGVTTVDLSGDVLFDFGSSAIRSDAAAQLAKVAHVLRQKATGRVQVLGHTDSVGSEAANQQLSEQRAVAVVQWLQAKEGIPAELLEARGLGETRPIAHNTKPDGSDDPAGRAKNRRVEVVFG
jgi:outer membrane protein OmpA-like peptidoglycan-associated protein